MPVATKVYQFLLTDLQGRCFYVDNGVVKKMSLPGFDGTTFSPFLRQHPAGWKELQTSWATHSKYWGLFRAFTVPMQFIGDGAIIVRNQLYIGKGYEEEIYIRILQMNQNPTDAGYGKYELMYIGRLDLTQADDQLRHGITVPTLEAGVLTYLSSNDSVPYEYPLDINNNDGQILYDGVNLYDKFKYVIPEFQSATNDNGHTTVSTAIPISFESNEGDNVGIIQGDGQDEIVPADIDSYAASSANYFFSSASPIQVLVSGTVSFRMLVTGDEGPNYLSLLIATSLGNKYYLVGTSGAQVEFTATQLVTYNLNQVINLAANEKMFLIAVISHFEGGATEVDVQWQFSNVYLAFTSITPPSTSYFYFALTMWDKLVMSMSDGRYHGDSNFLRAHQNLVLTSTNSLRQLDGATVVYNVADFFNDFDCLKNMGLKVADNKLWIEPKTDLYKSDNQIFDIGEIADLHLIVANDQLANTGTFGYKSQDYRQRNGLLEFNTTTIFKFPVNTIKKDYTKILKARGDCYGIEYERAKIGSKDTTDSTGDNQVFIVNVTKPENPPQQSYRWIKIVYNNGFSTHYFLDTGVYMDVILQPTLPLPTNIVTADTTLNQVAAGPAAFALYILNSGLYPNWNNGIQYTGDVATIDGVTAVANMYIPFRAAYSSILGVRDNTVFNIEEMTPHRMMLAHGPQLHSMMLQLTAERITFQKTDKNGDLITTLGMVTIAEKQDEPISTLPNPYFMPYYAQFTTIVPLTFNKILSGLGTGYIRGTYYGQPIYFLPIGKMDAKPTINQAQSWKILLSESLNDLGKLKNLSSEGLFTFDG